MTVRALPCSIEAEQAVLGGLMLVPERLNEIADFLHADDFLRRDHALIFRAISELVARGVPADAVTLGEWFEAQGAAERVGGMSYLLSLANTTPSAANIVAYAEVVKEKATLRALIAAASATTEAAYEARGATSRDIAARAASAMLEIAGSQRLRGARSMRDVGRSWFASLMARMESKGYPGIETPWPKFNEKTGGLQAAMLYVIAARPSIGKTVMMLNVAVNAALAGHRTMVFAMEQSAEALYSRAACAEKSVDGRFIRDPDPDDDETIGKISNAVATLHSAPLIIDDRAGLTWQEIAISAKREHMRSPLAMVCIDHMHIMRTPGKGRLDTEYADISREFKALAKALNIPVVLLAQLNRGVEGRTNKRPTLSDLRESGGLEQDGDVITLLYRDDYYAAQEGRGSRYPGYIEMNVCKQRDGETGVVWGAFTGKYSRIDPVKYIPAETVAEPDENKYAVKPRFSRPSA